MPPKKKGKGKKKKEKPLGRAGGLTVEEKYNESTKRIETLLDHLTLRTDIAGRADQRAKILHSQLMNATEEIIEAKETTKDISSDLKRQYVAMESELSGEIVQSKSRVVLLEEKLQETEIELANEKEEKKAILKEKNEKIAELENKIDSMEFAYENILHDSFDEMVQRLDKLKANWKRETMDLQSKNKALLLDLGLNPLEF